MAFFFRDNYLSWGWGARRGVRGGGGYSPLLCTAHVANGLVSCHLVFLQIGKLSFSAGALEQLSLRSLLRQMIGSTDRDVCIFSVLQWTLNGCGCDLNCSAVIADHRVRKRRRISKSTWQRYWNTLIFLACSSLHVVFSCRAYLCFCVCVPWLAQYAVMGCLVT